MEMTGWLCPEYLHIIAIPINTKQKNTICIGKYAAGQ